MGLIYCYGVIGDTENQRFSVPGTLEDKRKVSGKPDLTDIRGFDENKVYLTPFQDIFAVISNVSNEFNQESIDKNIKNMKWLVEKGQIHEQVIDIIMKESTIIPMKFCTIFESEEKVKEMMKERYADLKFNLKNLNNKIEMSVKVYYDIEKLKKQIFDKDKDLKEKYEKAEEKLKKSPGAAYFEKQKIDILLKERSHQGLNEKADNIFENIKKLSIDARKNEPLNKKLTGKDMLLNTVFLIEKENIENFKRKIEELNIGGELEIQVFGGFPPYNFIS
jgi:ribosomal protein S10